MTQTIQTYLIFDGSFEGFLSAVFLAYEQKLEKQNFNIANQQFFVPSLWQTTIEVKSDDNKAQRVLKKLTQLFDKRIKDILWAFLSEKPQIYTQIFRVIDLAISYPNKNILQHLTDPNVLAVSQAVKMVSRERHRMQAFVRFELTDSGIYFAKISPDFNVLPLVAKFFAKRFLDQSFVIFDLYRGFGIFYDHHKQHLEEVLQIDESFLKNPKANYDEKEQHYQRLWQAYFRHVSIEERKNMALHIRQMPKRYWKYLTEKQAID